MIDDRLQANTVMCINLKHVLRGAGASTPSSLLLLPRLPRLLAAPLRGEWRRLLHNTASLHHPTDVGHDDLVGGLLVLQVLQKLLAGCWRHRRQL